MVTPYLMLHSSVHGGPRSGATFMTHDLKFFENHILKAFGECLDDIYCKFQLIMPIMQLPNIS